MKKIIALSLVLLLAAGGIHLLWAQDSTFPDVSPGDWFYTTVMAAAERGILSGYPDGSFKPDKKVRYGEFLAMCLFAEKPAESSATGHWAMPFYNAAVEKGYFRKDEISPEQLDEVIPRQHMALLLAGVAGSGAAAKETARTGNNVSAMSAVFSDTGNCAYTAQISFCAERGILSGYPDGSFRPEAGLTRCEAAAAVMRYAALLDEKLGEGKTVTAILPGGNRIVRDEEDQYYLAAGNSILTPIEAPDRSEQQHAAELIRPDHRKILDEVIATAKITGSSAGYTFSYSQPEIPAEYHFAADLHIYQKNRQGGDDILFYYNSDAGWLTDESRYDASAHPVSVEVQGIGSIDGKILLLRFEIYDLTDLITCSLGEGAELCFTQNADGSFECITTASRYHDGNLKTYITSDSRTAFPFRVDER